MNNNEFKEFLKSDSVIMSFKDQYNTWKNIVKLPGNKNIDILYSSSGGRENKPKPLEIQNNLEYAGFYDKEKDQLYNLSYDIRSHLNLGEEDYIKLTDLGSELNKKLNDKLVEYIESHKQSLINSAEVFNISAEPDISYITKSFINGATPESIGYNYNIATSISKMFNQYEFPNDKNLIEYLTQNNYVDSVFDQYKKEFSNKIISICVQHEKNVEEMKSVCNNPTHPLHYRKALNDVFRDKDFKTVNISIDKNNINMTFKYDAITMKNLLKSSNSKLNMSSWNIPLLAQREEFERNYGRYADFSCKDISQISFGRKIIYDRADSERQRCQQAVQSQKETSKFIGADR